MKRNGMCLILCTILVCLISILFAGCAEKQETNVENMVEELPKEGLQWQTLNFAEPSNITDGAFVYIVDYQEDLVQKPDFKSESVRRYRSNFNFYNDKIYILSFYFIEETGEHRYYMDSYDLNSKERINREISIDIPELPGFYISMYQVYGDGKMVAFYPEFNSDNSAWEHFYAVFINNEGAVQEIRDINPALKELGIIYGEDGFFVDITCDNNGFLYVCDQDLPRVGVIDNTGALADIMEGMGIHEGEVACSMKSPEGIPIFMASNVREKKNILFWYDTEKPGIRILSESVYENASSHGINQFGEIYYIRKNSIVRWNAKTGVKENIFKCKGTGIGENGTLQMCMTNSEGTLFLLDFSGKEVCLYEFGNEPPKVDNEITIADICWWRDDYFGSHAAGFSRKNPSCNIKYESEDTAEDMTQWQAYHDRIMAEIVAGKGPEILLVDRKDLQILSDKGVLADLSGVLPKETEEQIFKGVLAAGTIDGKLVGLADSVRSQTVLVSKNVWNKNTWTVEEFVHLVEENEGNLEVIFAGSSGEGQPDNILYYMAMKDVKNSPFVDFEKGECYFDSELFRKVLELSKRYGGNEDQDGNGSVSYEEKKRELKEALDNGRAIAYPDTVFGLSDFSTQLEYLGEDYYYVGYPTSGSSGNYLNCREYMVVNKAAAEMDMIQEYIRYLFEEDNQRGMGSSTVRKDVLSNSLVYYNTEVDFDRGDGILEVVGIKPDGTTYLEEYLAYVNGCVQLSEATEEIWEMVSEEAAYYFAGQKELDKTADVIQRRVQLYLDERK